MYNGHLLTDGYVTEPWQVPVGRNYVRVMTLDGPRYYLVPTSVPDHIEIVGS
jgi:hypothetical protein